MPETGDYSHTEILAIKKDHNQRQTKTTGCPNNSDNKCEIAEFIAKQMERSLIKTDETIKKFHEDTTAELNQCNTETKEKTSKRSLDIISGIADKLYDSITPWDHNEIHDANRLTAKFKENSNNLKNGILTTMGALQSVQKNTEEKLTNMTISINDLFQNQAMILSAVEDNAIHNDIIHDALMNCIIAENIQDQTSTRTSQLKQAFRDLEKDIIPHELFDNRKLTNITDHIKTVIPKHMQIASTDNIRRQALTNICTHSDTNHTFIIIEIIFKLTKANTEYKTYKLEAYPIKMLQNSTLHTTIQLPTKIISIPNNTNTIMHITDTPQDGRITTHRYISYHTDTSCAFNILNNNISAIKDTCTFTITDEQIPTNKVIQVLDRTFIISHTNPIHLECENHSEVHTACNQCIYVFGQSCRGKLTHNTVLEEHLSFKDNTTHTLGLETVNIALVAHDIQNISGANIREHKDLQTIYHNMELHKLKLTNKTIPIHELAKLIENIDTPDFHISPENHSYLLVIINAVFLIILATCLCRVNRKLGYISAVPVATAKLLIENSIMENSNKNSNSCAGTHMVYIGIFTILAIILLAFTIRTKRKKNSIIVILNKKNKAFKATQHLTDFPNSWDPRQAFITPHKFTLEHKTSTCLKTTILHLSTEDESEDYEDSNEVTITFHIADKILTLPNETKLSMKNMRIMRNASTDNMDCQIAILTKDNYLIIPKLIDHLRPQNQNPYLQDTLYPDLNYR